jgi:hypothetical protein
MYWHELLYSHSTMTFPSFHFTASLYLTSFHFTEFLDDFHHSFILPHLSLSFIFIFLKLLGLLERLPKAPADNWFQSCMAYLQRDIFRYLSFAFCS